MPRVSNKGQEMPASPIRRLIPYANLAKSRGIDVYRLNIGQPDIKAPAGVFNALKTLADSTMAYTDSAGYPYYRDGLVEYYKNIGIKLAPEDIIVTNGGSEAIIFAFLTWLVHAPF